MEHKVLFLILLFVCLGSAQFFRRRGGSDRPPRGDRRGLGRCIQNENCERCKDALKTTMKNKDDENFMNETLTIFTDCLAQEAPDQSVDDLSDNNEEEDSDDPGSILENLKNMIGVDESIPPVMKTVMKMMMALNQKELLAPKLKCCLLTNMGKIDENGNVNKTMIEEDFRAHVGDEDVLNALLDGVNSCNGRVPDCMMKNFADCVVQRCTDSLN